MSEVQKSFWESDQELTQEAQQHLANLEALVRFRELHPEIFEMISPKVKALLTEGEHPLVPVLSEEQIKEQILTEPRKNKYGLVMDPLEQELENIKLWFRDIEKFDPYNSQNETSYDFFIRVYGKYRDAGLIYQADLMWIDNRLLKNLKDYFRYGRNKKHEGQIESLQLLLPSKHIYTRNIVNTIIDRGLKRKEVSHIASSLLDKRKHL